MNKRDVLRLKPGDVVDTARDPGRIFCGRVVRVTARGGVLVALPGGNQWFPYHHLSRPPFVPQSDDELHKINSGYYD